MAQTGPRRCPVLFRFLTECGGYNTNAVWLPQSSGTTQTLVNQWGTDALHVWAVGACGTIFQHLPN